MRLTFLGTGTSMGVPIIGCTCPVCTSADPNNSRLRTSALLQLGEQAILIDAGPDFRQQALTQRITHLDAVLLTHAHYDHVAGLDDLRPLTLRTDRSMPIYGHPDTLASVRTRFDYAFTPTPAHEGTSRPALTLNALSHYEPCQVELTPAWGRTTLEVLPFDVRHGKALVTGYRIGRLGYITDASYLPPESLELLHGLDLLVLNALRHEPHPTHLSLGEALAIIEQLQPRRARLVHLTHTFDHATTNQELPCHIELAYDGLSLNVAEA